MYPEPERVKDKHISQLSLQDLRKTINFQTSILCVPILTEQPAREAYLLGDSISSWTRVAPMQSLLEVGRQLGEKQPR